MLKIQNRTCLVDKKLSKEFTQEDKSEFEFVWASLANLQASRISFVCLCLCALACLFNVFRLSALEFSIEFEFEEKETDRASALSQSHTQRPTNNNTHMHTFT